jgi:hypothetical protein
LQPPLALLLLLQALLVLLQVLELLEVSTKVPAEHCCCRESWLTLLLMHCLLPQNELQALTPSQRRPCRPMYGCCY